MKHLLISLSSLIIISFLQSCGHEKGDVLIQNITTIDAINGQRKNQSILIKENRIIRVSDSSDKMTATEVIDGTGKYMIPGLWDAHVHLTFEDEIEKHMFDLFIANGITSIRDTGGQIDRMVKLKELALDKVTHRPRVKIAGPLIDGMPRVYDGSSPGVPDISKGISTPEEAKAFVAELAEAGVDLVKAYEMLTPELFEAVVEEAKKHKLKVTGHIPLQMTVHQASDLGMSSVEHMRNLEMSMVSRSEEKVAERVKIVSMSQDSLGYGVRSRLHSAYRFSSLKEIDPQEKIRVLNTLNRNQTWQIPTLALVMSSELLPWSDDEWIKTFDYLPAKTKQTWLKDCKQMATMPVSDNQKSYMNWASGMLQDLQDNDIPIMAGTDCPIFFLTPGFSLHRELQTFVEKASMDPLAALKTATYNPALYFNMEDELGTIENGKIADLVILDKNPLDNIRNTKSIHTVIKDGYIHNKKALEEMLRI